jgi:hypothetical protein
MPLSERERQVGELTLLGAKYGVIALDLAASIKAPQMA